MRVKGDYQDFSGPLPKIRLYGSNPARPKEEELAIRILKGAPRSVGVLPVAHYFEAIDDMNEDGESYNAAWETRWNPVIVGFYKTTQLEDKYVLKKGDTIPWCAAFLNWCLQAADLPPTESASSSSFRTYGELVMEPEPGDIVVFKHANPDEAAAGRGHVGFFDGFDGPRIRVGVSIPMRDGVRLKADLWLPDVERRVSMILYRTPYGKSNTSPDFLRPQHCVEAGFAAVVQEHPQYHRFVGDTVSLTNG